VQITRGYRTELNLNNKQITACKKHAGAARYAHNWGLKRKQEVYQTTGRRISAMELHRELNRRKQSELPWMYARQQVRSTRGSAGFGRGFHQFLSARATKA
jgi:putative transposase